MERHDLERPERLDAPAVERQVSASEGYRDDPDDIFTRPGDRPPAALTFYHASRANLRDLHDAQSAAYIAQHKESRPWLAAAEHATAPVQRVYASLDGGIGHAIERHDGRDDPRDDEAQYRRVTELVDPAGGTEQSGRHRCGTEATRIHDPTAFATAFAKGIEHRAVIGALDSDYDPKRKPNVVDVPISELLGDDGHRLCSGYRLAGEDLDQAFRDRRAWVEARVAGRSTEDMQAPRAERIASFEGGSIRFAVGRNAEMRCHEIVTMFPVAEERPVDG